MKTNADLTLYMGGVNPVTRTEEWTRVQVRAVFWEDRKAANVLRSGNLEADRVAVYIPLARGPLALKIGDVMVKGLVSDEITQNFTMADLRRKYSDVATIRSVDTMDYGSPAMQHWELSAS
jgi:hypothetical protein